MQGRKLYVGGLSYNSTEQALEAYFSRSGTVDTVKIISDRDTGRSKGFAFVEMATSADAEKAISDHNGKEFDGRTLTVSEAKPQAPRDNNRGSGGGGGGRW
jgi:RNA recognition motif-containing protein